MQSSFHVAIIMDGNGRWASRRGLPRFAGHRSGSNAVRRVIEASPELGIDILTLYAFSSDNWKRPVTEVSALMELFQEALAREADRCLREGVRLEVIGRRDRLPAGLPEAIERVEAATAQGRRLWLRLAVDYSSRWAICQALRTAPDPAESASGRYGIGPDVDLLIRTGGERRLSDFLLWEAAYAELHFSPVLWPDFGRKELDEAVRDFQARQRRFGGLPTDSPAPVVIARPASPASYPGYGPHGPESGSEWPRTGS